MKCLIHLLLVFLLFSCKKDEKTTDPGNMVDATIIAYHNSVGCSKGWIIQTDSLTFRSETMPDEQKLKDVMTEKGLPIPIKVEFTANDELSMCSDIYRKVTKWALVIAAN